MLFSVRAACFLLLTLSYKGYQFNPYTKPSSTKIWLKFQLLERSLNTWLTPNHLSFAVHLIRLLCFTLGVRVCDICNLLSEFLDLQLHCLDSMFSNSSCKLKLPTNSDYSEVTISSGHLFCHECIRNLPK